MVNQGSEFTNSSPDLQNNKDSSAPDGKAQEVSDNLGKLPLAMQQLGLAASRANETGNVKLAKLIEAKMLELVKSIDATSNS